MPSASGMMLAAVSALLLSSSDCGSSTDVLAGFRLKRAVIEWTASVSCVARSAQSTPIYTTASTRVSTMQIPNADSQLIWPPVSWMEAPKRSATGVFASQTTTPPITAAANALPYVCTTGLPSRLPPNRLRSINSMNGSANSTPADTEQAIPTIHRFGGSTSMPTIMSAVVKPYCNTAARNGCRPSSKA